ncbi:RsmB/NOP family class I SAM-dependent RNA methyltransferase [Chondromyces crocatus]|uniref:Sun protein n=1 Tax=Chondromyces crocatus TaxID=52 RepID=A0A0K1E714_CHOCO|nr:transcription antitermination factor NusB [Chondromyces crocatus]AKT36368.1 Sun protein [Chondromyces crocatus]
MAAEQEGPDASGPALAGDARRVAARVLERVWEESAFASAALDAELSRLTVLDGRDAGLATELVYGVLRTQAFLEEQIDKLAVSRRWAGDPAVRAHLLMGAYSLLFLDRVPAFAAVSEAVNAMRVVADDRVGAFANAVLRRLADEAAKGRPALIDAVVASAPGWLRGALRRAIGRAGASAFLSAGPVPPPLGLCLAPAEDREAWIARLGEAAKGATIEAGKASPHAILVRGAGELRRLPGFGETWIGQEEGAQVVALLLGAKPGERVLDACAGRGNKTWLLSRRVGATGDVEAADLHPNKLRVAATTGARATYAVDWSAGTGRVPEGYDRVLVDAPCSGVGTLRRRPEIGLKREAGDLERLSSLQVAIARSAASRAREGGRLVFAVCSVLREECEGVVERLSSDPGPGEPEVKLVPTPFDAEEALALGLPEGASSVRLLPHVHGTDGYFAAMFTVHH